MKCANPKCDNEFEKTVGNKKFCSKHCQNVVKCKRSNDKYKQIHGEHRPKKLHQLICKFCNKEFICKEHDQQYCSRKCASDSHIVYLNIPQCLESADRKIDKNIGYVRVYCPMHKKANNWGYVYEHVIIAEQKVGRDLFPNEVVHHKDGVRWNNDPNNLEVMDRIEHSKLSGKKKE